MAKGINYSGSNLYVDVSGSGITFISNNSINITGSLGTTNINKNFEDITYYTTPVIINGITRPWDSNHFHLKVNNINHNGYSFCKGYDIYYQGGVGTKWPYPFFSLNTLNGNRFFLSYGGIIGGGGSPLIRYLFHPTDPYNSNNSIELWSSNNIGNRTSKINSQWLGIGHIGYPEAAGYATNASSKYAVFLTTNSPIRTLFFHIQAPRGNLLTCISGTYITTGSFTVGMQATSSLSNSLQVSGNIIPYSTENADMNLGSSTLAWNNLYGAVVQTSDKNSKKDIDDCKLGLKFINDLKPVKYRFKDGSRTHYGLIAQEVKELLDKWNIDTTDFAAYIETENNIKFIRYTEFLSPLIKAIQELSARIELLEKEIEARGL